MMHEAMPPDLGAAIATQPMWLQIWVLVLVLVNLVAVFFAITRQSGKFGIRLEALAIVFSFVAAGLSMSWLYQQVGYVRLLGLPHLVFWLPVYIWIFGRYRRGSYSFPFKQYLAAYFVIAGISLIVDASDVIRYLLGNFS